MKKIRAEDMKYFNALSARANKTNAIICGATSGAAVVVSILFAKLIIEQAPDFMANGGDISSIAIASFLPVFFVGCALWHANACAHYIKSAKAVFLFLMA